MTENHNKGFHKRTLRVVLGIVFLVVSFFSLPFVWIAFGGLVGKCRIAEAIEKRGITDINTLAQIFAKNPQEVINTVNSLIAKGYLDYTLLYDKIQKNGQIKCPNCGAPIKVDKEKRFCEYCKTNF